MPEPVDSTSVPDSSGASAALFRPVVGGPSPFPEITGLRCERLIGRGATSTVWLARQEQPVARHVAVKILERAPEGVASLARFLREWSALAAAGGTGVAAMLDAGHTLDGRAYLVMEFVDGEAITHACDRRSLPLSERLRLVADLAATVARAHARGIVHRDVKPSNVLVRFDGSTASVTLLDFGLAAFADPRASEEPLTHPGVPIGTVEWMAPEQTGLCGDEIDGRADVYSIGLLLERLWVGVPRWQRATSDAEEFRARLESVSRGRQAPTLPPEPPTHWDDLDERGRAALAALVRRATSPLRDARTTSAAQLRDELIAIAATSSRSMEIAGVTTRLRTRNGLVVGLLLAVTLAIVLGSRWTSGGRQRAPADWHSVGPAVNSPGRLVAWGENGDGRCELGSGEGYISVACGPTWTLAVEADGTVVGAGGGERAPLPIPEAIRDRGERAVKVVTTDESAAILTESGRVVEWRAGEQAPSVRDGVADLAAGRRTLLLVLRDGSVEIPNPEVPFLGEVPGALHPVVRAAIGHKTVAAQSADGRLYAWGSDETGIVTEVQGLEAAAFALGGVDSRTTAMIVVDADGSVHWFGSGPVLGGKRSVGDRAVRAEPGSVVGAKRACWFLLALRDGGVLPVGAVPLDVLQVPEAISPASGVPVIALSAGSEHAAVIFE